MQRLLGNVGALQLVIAYSEAEGHATPLPSSPSLVRNLVPDPGKVALVQRLPFQS